MGGIVEGAYSQYEEIARDPGYRAELRDVAARAKVCPVYVALDDDGTPIGTATYVPGPDNPFAEVERDGEAGIRMLAVDSAARGQGAGTALVEALVERARAEGRHQVVLLTLPAMGAAHRIYERIGFQRDPDRDWWPEPALQLLAYRLAIR